MITNKKAQSWRTPLPLFQTLNKEYRFTIDLAASISNHLLPRYWTEAHNSLKRMWTNERGYWNPPFSSVAEWLEFAIWQRDKHNVFSVGLVLGSIETAWFHDLAVKTEKHLFRRRVSYDPPPGVDKSTPSFPSILLVQTPGFRAIGNGLAFTRVRDGNTGEYIDGGNINTASFSDALRETNKLPAFVDGGLTNYKQGLPAHEMPPPDSKFLDDDLPF